MTSTPTLLVVDDDAAIRDLVGKRLGGAGYRVEMAADGEEALAAVERGSIQMVVLDIMMPGLDGFAVLERLRESRDGAELPVIVLSARQEGEDVVRALHAGANDYAVKPVDFGLFLKRVATHLTLAAGRGRTIGPYRINEKLGSGGMGIVFAAEDTRTGDAVAVKVLPRAMTVNDTNVQRFLREARLAARVDHPNVVKIHEAGRDGEIYFFAMELVRGETLRTMAERAPLSPDRVRDIARQLSAGLAALAGSGILHRDVKPGNVIVTEEGVAKLGDFGIARDLTSETRLTRTGVGVGSLLYASPEQMRGRAELRSDIYSLGATLYFASTGQDPFPSGHDADWILAYKLHNRPGVRRAAPDVPEDLATVIERMMAPMVEDRFPTYAALVEALVERSPRSRGWVWWAVAAVFLSAAVSLFLLR